MSYRALGIDTSNYTTSAALYCDGRVTQSKRLLPVAPGQLGLRQSEAVFAHVKALGDVAGTLLRGEGHVPNSVGVSCAPRNVEGSYMPCFLTGVMAAEVSAAALGVPLHRFSHQQGHIAAALYGAAQLNWMTERFVAFHLSGGTTECVLIESLAQGRMTLISKTNDLNAGQVVDRVGHMLGLSFPAGAALDTLARQSERSFQIRPTMMGGNPCLSGVENQCADRVKRGESPADVANFCIQSILAALSGMVQNAMTSTGCERILFAGGVMSNSIIRPAIETRFGGIFAPSAFSCDNAAGIAVLSAAAEGENVFTRSSEEGFQCR